MGVEKFSGGGGLRNFWGGGVENIFFLGWGVDKFSGGGEG